MKRTLTFFFLSFFFFNISLAETGTGNIKLSDRVIYNFHDYLKSVQKKPVKFLVTEDGKNSMSWFCPYAKCAPTGSKSEEKVCKRRMGKNCYIFALKRTVRWKNDITKNLKSSKRKFSSKMDLISVKEKLTELGFIGNNNQIKKKKEKAKEKISITNNDINNLPSNLLEDLEKLKQLFDDGWLTEEEFKKAKEKLLN